MDMSRFSLERSYTAVMVKDLSRLGRDYVSVGNYTDSYFPERNVRFIAVNDSIDSDEGESEIAPFKNILFITSCVPTTRWIIGEAVRDGTMFVPTPLSRW